MKLRRSSNGNEGVVESRDHAHPACTGECVAAIAVGCVAVAGNAAGWVSAREIELAAFADRCEPCRAEQGAPVVAENRRHRETAFAATRARGCIGVVDTASRHCPADSGHRGRITQASRLVDLAERDCTLFHCGDEAFAEFEHDAHRQSWPVPSQGFSAWLRLQYFEASDGGAPNNEALQTALARRKGNTEGCPHARGAVVERHANPSLSEHHWRIIDET